MIICSQNELVLWIIFQGLTINFTDGPQSFISLKEGMHFLAPYLAAKYVQESRCLLLYLCFHLLHLAREELQNF
ncbi:hypothetical protein Lalb_Chr05g0220301 [Lupinus albus]|uniref:Uncharacterized protein n=1 Tax=Lupinus albus TaxID=3870 RepID=A0A6A4QIF0_LUPAL|nr:hypothetical protein Lalb_Chr05g0220301 [Lupinus albus]